MLHAQADSRRQAHILKVYDECGAILRDDHLVYSNWDHGRDYIDKHKLYTQPHIIAGLANDISKFYTQQAIRFDTVVAPEKGGIILSQWVAFHSAAAGKSVFSVYAEKQQPAGWKDLGLGMKPPEIFGFSEYHASLVTGKRVLVVDDNVRTGGSVRKVVQLVHATGGEVVGVGALCCRRKLEVVDVGDVPIFYAALALELDDWLHVECPLCQEGKPINPNLGKGRAFLDSKRMTPK